MVRGLPARGFRSAAPARSRVDSLWVDGAVAAWRSRFNDRGSKFYTFQDWFLWLLKCDGFADLTPSLLLKRLDESGDIRLARRLAILVDDYVMQEGGTWEGMVTKRSHVRSFFRNHNLELPRTFFHATPTSEPVKAKLTVVFEADCDDFSFEG